MARANIHTDYAETDTETGAGEWQALRGELVALLDKVESRYGAGEPAVSGVARRVQHLRSQVETPEPNVRHREALRSVKRAVDRFSDRDPLPHDDFQDDLTLAISEIRNRQGNVAQRPAQGAAELRDLGALVGGMSNRLERLEGELKTQRSGNGEVREIAGQVEQLTHVVELLAGAVGETGQVKRLETQMAVLAAMIEESHKVDLDAVNRRLDEVSATVAKLADLQAQQMEREIARDKRSQTEARVSPAAELEPAMHAIEASMRNVYDRIDAIEKNVSMSSGDFERLTSELSAFTKAMKSQAGQPDILIERVDALASRIEGLDSPSGEVVALRGDIGALRDAVLGSMEPRFVQLENRIEALSERVVPTDTRGVEDQLKKLMARMDEAGAQLDGLARLYSGEEKPDLETLATLVAERTSDAMTRKAPAPVAMFGPESLKSIEDRLGEMIRATKKAPDYEALADMVATRATEAMARTKPAAPAASEQSIAALEQRMASLLNTAGKDTADRLARLEAALAERTKEASVVLGKTSPEQNAIAPAKAAAPEMPIKADPEAGSRLDSILASLGASRDDSMPANPAEEKPLIDKAFRNEAPMRKEPVPKAAEAPQARAAAQPAPSTRESAPAFDPSAVERPPRPKSSFAPSEQDPFAEAPTTRAAAVESPTSSSTSTFVAAARRAQRAKQEEAEASDTGNSLIGRALARVRSRKVDAAPAVEAAPQPVAPPVPTPEPVPVQPVVEAEKTKKPRRKLREPKEKAVLPEGIEATEVEASFLTRHRRPLLLAATLVAVSMLALNLVLQRSAQNVQTAPAAVSTAPAETNTANPPPSDDESSVVPPRVIEMIDPTATGSINPGAPMSFSKASTAAAATTAMPQALTAVQSDVEPAASAAAAPTGDVPETTGSIGEASATPAEPFELAPEALGPLELRQAAANGDARAQFEIAAIYTEGQAIEQDFAAAAKWYERAAAQSFVPAQYRLANLYEVGTGVEKDLEEARLWYQRAAEAGNRMAMHNLAALYAGGQLGEQQFELAAEWFERAANHGMTDSQFNLGMLYARGLGVEQDFEQSYRWFSLAAQSGDKDAAQARDDIAKSLSAEAVGRINGTLSDWKPDPIELASNFAPIGTWSEKFEPGQAITSRDVITKVQQALTRLGFDVGTADGVAGPKTAEAIKAFERGVGMSEIGKVNPRFLAVLGSQPV